MVDVIFNTETLQKGKDVSQVMYSLWMLASIHFAFIEHLLQESPRGYCV